MSDYYDANPIRVPKIPIGLIGFFGSEPVQVANQLGALTGLNTADVAHLMIHKEGASIAKILLGLGPEHYRKVEVECLDMALKSDPPGIVSLPHDMLSDDTTRRDVLERTALVYLHQDYEPMVRKVRSMVEERPGVFFPWVDPEHVCAGNLERLLEEHRAGYDEAMLHVDVTGKRPLEIARTIIEHFELWRED